MAAGGSPLSSNFSPTTPMMIIARQTSRLTSRGSFRTNIPISTMPVVPRPVQTAYTVPTGNPPRVASAMKPSGDMPFDMQRMVVGGFEPILRSGESDIRVEDARQSELA